MPEIPKSTIQCEYISPEARYEVSLLPLETTESDRKTLLAIGRCCQAATFRVVPDHNDILKSCPKHVGMILFEIAADTAHVETIERYNKFLRSIVEGTVEEDLAALGVTINDVRFDIIKKSS